jgi:hypothetical protein
MIKGLQIIEGKYSKHIMNESINTNTRVCGMCWYEWRQAKDVINFFDNFIKVNNMFIDGYQTLEKSNSDNS